VYGQFFGNSKDIRRTVPCGCYAVFWPRFPIVLELEALEQAPVDLELLYGSFQ